MARTRKSLKAPWNRLAGLHYPLEISTGNIALYDRSPGRALYCVWNNDQHGVHSLFSFVLQNT